MKLNIKNKYKIMKMNIKLNMKQNTNLSET